MIPLARMSDYLPDLTLSTSGEFTTPQPPILKNKHHPGVLTTPQPDPKREGTYSHIEYV